MFSLQKIAHIRAQKTRYRLRSVHMNLTHYFYDCKCVQGLLIDWSYCTSGDANCKPPESKQLKNEARLV